MDNPSQGVHLNLVNRNRWAGPCEKKRVNDRPLTDLLTPIAVVDGPRSSISFLAFPLLVRDSWKKSIFILNFKFLTKSLHSADAIKLKSQNLSFFLN